MLNELSDSELILYCADKVDDRHLMDSFFRRLNYYIDKRIRVILSLSNVHDIDTINDVKYELVKKIKNGLLMGARGKKNPKAWFGKVVANLTIDRLRKNNLLRDAYENLAEKEASSLPDHQNYDDKGVIEDFILKYGDDDHIDEIKQKTGILQSEIEKLGEDYRLTLKTAIMLYEPLTDDVIREIANKRKTSYEEIFQEANKIRGDLLNRYNENLNSQHKAANLWVRINKLKQQHFILLQNKKSHHKRIGELQKKINSINNLQNNPDKKNRQIIQSSEKQIADLQAVLKKTLDIEEEIERKTKTRNNHLKNYKIFIRPTAQQISNLLAISEDNVTYVNTLLKRARERLQKNFYNKKQTTNVHE